MAACVPAATSTHAPVAERPVRVGQGVVLGHATSGIAPVPTSWQEIAPLASVGSPAFGENTAATPTAYDPAAFRSMAPFTEPGPYQPVPVDTDGLIEL